MTRLRILSIFVGLALAAPAAAQAATLDANRSCYSNSNVARLSGSGFAPDSQISFAVNGRELGQTVMSDSAGDVLVTYDPARTRIERELAIRATDSEGESARTTIHVSPIRRVTADPDSSPNVRTWKAVLALFGFGNGNAFVHYVDPDGVHRKTVGLGELRGPCGRLKTGKRRVMPFDNPEFGVWRLQFDTRRRYDKDTNNKRRIPVRVYRG
ncbi:MAG: hypothetical protein ACRDJY_07065 [Thermoleophilaceae bacterium]